MKKNLFILSGIIFLTQCLFGQKCNDTLKVKCLWLEDWNLRTYEYRDMEGVTFNPTKQPQIVLGTMFELSGLYQFGDTITTNYTVTSGSDTIQTFTIRHLCDSGYAIGDTVGLIDYVWDIRSLGKGEYQLKFGVTHTTKDGWFCDSIVERSSQTVTFYVDTQAPVQEIAQETALKVWPNPAREHIHVECEKEMRNIILCNALGQQVFRISPNASQAEMQTTGLPRGLYLLKVETATGTAIRKIAIQ